MPVKSNFSFLHANFPALENFGAQAERYRSSDPNACMMKLGMLAETMVTLIFAADRLSPPADNTAAGRINALAREGLVPPEQADILHRLRKYRNKAVHENYASAAAAGVLLSMAHGLCEWFMRTYVDPNFLAPVFETPGPEEQAASFPAPAPSAGTAGKTATAEEAKAARLVQEAERAAAASPPVAAEERRERAKRAAARRVLSEAETRFLIDEQLRQVGWEADTENLRHALGARPEKGRDLAIAEWPTGSASGGKGFADYALFAGGRLVGLVEAKAGRKDIPSVIDHQCKDYARDIREEDAPLLAGAWGEYKVPFVFAANGRPYLEQLKTMSGVWFLDLRRPDNAPRALRGWPGPAGLLDMLAKDPARGDQNLADMPFDLLRDPDGLNLRPYQIEAVRAAERAVGSGRRSVLLAMATGTGKTRTVLGMIHRFLKSGRFRRILFLVDRAALGEQAQDVFRDVKLEDLMPLDDLYTIKGLDDRDIDPETRVHVATVQGMIKRLLDNEGGPRPAVTDYDLIIIDEAHRGYILDREMAEDELLYRDQLDFQSKYRLVVDYFEAVRIALTATPALHTTRIFGPPVFRYSYREAVIDGHLVDHDAPHRLVTKLGLEGIHYRPGDEIVSYDPVTGEITNSEVLDDECLDFDLEDFNRRVITEDFNRAVLEEIARDIDPESREQGKTLVFAADDRHADLIVKILKEIFTARGVDNEAVMKITGSVGGGDRKRVLEAVRRFKNERFPSVVVTVDLLTTGIDVPEITRLVFLRRVKSRILFEQMLGRATRLCPAIRKTHFEIYDPVGVYDALEPVSAMRPVVAGPAVTFAHLLDGLEAQDDPDRPGDLTGRVAARLHRVMQGLDEALLARFVALSGGLDPAALAAELRRAAPEEAKKLLLACAEALRLLDGVKVVRERRIVISTEPDELLAHERGYGKSGHRPQDYLDDFADYVKAHINDIAALHIICSRPHDLDRNSLKHLLLTLEAEGFTALQLNTALARTTNREIAADIICLIRRYALGSALLGHEERIRRAVDRLKKAHDFTGQELRWIDRMANYLLQESVLPLSVFDEDGRFKGEGGFARIDRVFGNRLAEVVRELNDYLYDDGGRAA